MQNHLKLFIPLFAVYLAVCFYVFLHGRWALPRSRVVQIPYAAVFWMSALSIFIAMLVRKFLLLRVDAAFSIVGGYWMFLALYFIACCAVVDVARLVQHYTDWYPTFVKTNYAIVKLTIFSIVILGAASMIIVGYRKFMCPEITQLSLEVERRQSAVDELRIVAVSDIHLGSVVRVRHMQVLVDSINALKPDIVLIAGDLIDNSLKIVQAQRMDTILRRITTKYGCYGVLGNHDYFDDAAAAARFMRSAGITPLLDSAAVIDSTITILGRLDYYDKTRKPLSALLSAHSYPTIVLDHQPRNPQEAADCGVALQIMGHTHGGQVFPYTLVIRRMYGAFFYGYQKIGGTHFYTTAGIAGWGAPMRLGTRSEVVCINLKLVP